MKSLLVRRGEDADGQGLTAKCWQMYFAKFSVRGLAERAMQHVIRLGQGWKAAPRIIAGQAPPHIAATMINKMIASPLLEFYAPELNPVEPMRDELREKYFHNRIFDSLNALEDQLEVALRTFENNAPMVKFIVAWKWIVSALLN